MPFKKVLIANRGEIACRVARTCRRLGIAVAGVHSEADRHALHVREIGDSIEIGPPPALESYLRIGRIVEAALKVGADAVHPGYGFLAENPAFARAIAEAGLTFIGPSADVLAQFGDKAAAKAVARANSVPVVPGTAAPSADVEVLLDAISDMRLPVLLKAAAGGGGKGMRIVAERDGARQHVEAAMREGQSSFGRPDLIVEQFLPEARHVEVQILGDGRGEVIHLFDRECSLQRRSQKVIEEAPVESLPAGLREEILAHAVRLGVAVDYRGLGTVEFIVQGGRAFFLEVNPRIQVEHTVTEEVTGLDLVELQLRAVGEGRLPRQQDIAITGFAVQARLYAEDAAKGFLPSTGEIERLAFPANVRVDAGVAAGERVTPFYDPMIAKLIVSATDRQGAYAALRTALSETAVLGVETNRDFLAALAAREDVLRNQVHTGSIDAMLRDEVAEGEAAPPLEQVALAAALWLRRHRGPEADTWAGWAGLTGWRLRDGGPLIAAAPAIRLTHGQRTFEARYGERAASGVLSLQIGGEPFAALAGEPDGRDIHVINGRALVVESSVSQDAVSFVALDGRSYRFRVEPYLSSAVFASEGGGDGRVRAPLVGRVAVVDVRVGDSVTGGQRLAIMESMKMELSIQAPWAGVVTLVDCTADVNVERDQVLFHIARVREVAA